MKGPARPRRHRRPFRSPNPSRPSSSALGTTASDSEEVTDQDVRVVFLKTGDPAIELLEPIGPDGPIGKFIQKRGEGIHHLSFDVPDLEAALARCKAAGLT
jgi:methylmalonyl-CoA epimerase